MGASLLGLSGWFITAAAAAGMAGAGTLFNVFAPSAMVRFLALGRTAARYGERLATHDAVLHALAALRLRLLRRLLTRPHRAVERLRAAALLNRLTADVDLLDGALLRLVLPGLAGSVTILAATVLLWALVHPGVALVVGLGYLVLPNLVFLLGQRRARRPSRQAEAAMQATRTRLVEMVAAREDLAVYGQLSNAAAHVDTAVTRHAAARGRLDGIERATGLSLDLTGAVVSAAALGLGAWLVEQGTLDPPAPPSASSWRSRCRRPSPRCAGRFPRSAA
ncbi:MAG: ABC transporter transmembrane domain-containing protein [Paracoccaceae bacterium]